MRLEEPAEGGAVAVGNPATSEFEVVRTSLLPSVGSAVPADAVAGRCVWCCSRHIAHAVFDREAAKSQSERSVSPSPPPPPQALKTLGANKSAELPIKLFEVRSRRPNETVQASFLLLPTAPTDQQPNPTEPNRIRPPQISDVVLLAPEREVGARNERRLVAVVCNKEAGFEVIHGLLNRVMEVLGVPLKGEGAADHLWRVGWWRGSWRPSSPSPRT
jgi:phenylalanyl-tRNA synthetase beta subunit